MEVNRQILDEFIAAMELWGKRYIDCCEGPADHKHQYDVADPISVTYLQRGPLVQKLFFEHVAWCEVHCAVSRAKTGVDSIDSIALRSSMHPGRFDFEGEPENPWYDEPEINNISDLIPDERVREAIRQDKLHIVDWILEKFKNSKKLQYLSVKLDIAVPFDLDWVMEQVEPLKAMKALKEVLVIIGPMPTTNHNSQKFIKWKLEATEGPHGSTVWTWNKVKTERTEDNNPWPW